MGSLKVSVSADTRSMCCVPVTTLILLSGLAYAFARCGRVGRAPFFAASRCLLQRRLLFVGLVTILSFILGVPGQTTCIEVVAAVIDGGSNYLVTHGVAGTA